MITFSTDIADLILQRTFSDSNLGLNNSILRMTTGYKVNHAKDNAAGYSIINDLSKQISSMIQIQENTAQGIDLLNTAEGGLSQIKTLLERLRELATQASNGTYDKASRDAMQAEADEIIAQIEQIQSSTEYNGIKLYETPQEQASPIARLAQAARIKSTGDTSIKTNNTSYTFASTEGEVSSLELLSSPTVFSLGGVNTPQIATVSNNDGIMLAEESAPISGVVTFAANETKEITIDGVKYTVTNNTSNSNELSYSKDTSTQLITFTGNSYTIKGQKDVAHNLAINGQANYICGGDLNDSIKTASSISDTNYFYGCNGDDYFYTNSIRTHIYGESGNDTIVAEASYAHIYGGNGEDEINVTGSQCSVYGDADNDSITLISGSSNTINGGSGVNTYTGVFVNNTIVNVEGATDFAVDFTAKETKTLTINGINYEITNKTSANTLYYSIDEVTDQITFNSTNFTIVGDKNTSHNVNLKGRDITFYGSDLKDIILVTGNNHTIYAYEGDNEITCKSNGHFCAIYAGNGNNIIDIGNIYYSNYWYLGNGDNIVNIGYLGPGGAQLIYAGSGNNTINDNSTRTRNFYNGFGDSDNCSALKINAGETKNITINNINYTITNTSTENTHLFYEYNPVSKKVTIAGFQLTIIGQEDVGHDVILYGTAIHFYGGNKNDIIDTEGNATVRGMAGDDVIEIYNGVAYGGDGNDILTASGMGSLYLFGEEGNDTLYISASSVNANGGNGDDTFVINKSTGAISDTGGNNIYEVNTDNVSITGGDGNDSFYIKGENCTINGGSGNDYFVVDSTGNNTINGGTGDNYYVDNSGGNAVFNDAIADPNGLSLQFTSLNEEKVISLDGFEFIIQNSGNGSSSTNNLLKFSYNQNTKEFTFDGSAFTITAVNSSNFAINGSNNIINGSSSDDNINIKTGTNNIVNGLDGSDTIVMNSANNSIFGGNGSDTITINASTNLEINSGDGDDTLNITSNNNTNINADSGNDTITVTGTGNIIKASSGNNTITLNNDNNSVSATTGNNKLVINSSDNTITVTGNGNNTIGVQGNNNVASIGNVNGEISIIGNGNEITNSTGKNNVSIKGSDNTYSTTSGDKNITVNGSNNTINAGSGSDKITLSGDNNNAYGGENNDSFIVKSGSGNTVDGQGGSNTILDSSGVTTYTNATLIKSEPFKLNVKVDIGNKDDAYISTEISFNLFDFSVDFSTSTHAANSLAEIDEFLEIINKQLINIGTTINRLESVAESQTIKINNLISSRSTLRDADIAKESSNFVKFQILQQASTVLLASSRDLKAENVLGLLRNINN